MMRSRTALLLAFSFVFFNVNGLRDKSKRAQTDGQRAQKRTRGQRNEGGAKGRFSLQDGARCAWIAAPEIDAFSLGLSCKNGADVFSCEYQTKIAVCPQLASNPKTHWKLVARALRTQKRLCRDSVVVVGAGGCRVLFRLKEDRKSPRVLLPESKLCPERRERLMMAEDLCKKSWSSVCTFLFLMIESDECP